MGKLAKKDSTFSMPLATEPMVLLLKQQERLTKMVVFLIK